MQRIVMVLAFLLLASGNVLADYYDGLRAFDAKDYATAYAEWQAGAEQGDAASQYRLAGLHEQGFGVPQNYVQAHLYYNLAAAQGHEDARAARDALAEKMSTEEQAEARKLAAASSESAPATPGTEGAEVPPVDPAADTRPLIDADSLPLVLRAAVEAGDADAVVALIEAGVELDHRDDDGWTALMAAIALDQAEIAERLLDAAADPSLAAADGLTALLIAASMRKQDLVAALIAVGAPPDAADAQGVTPLLVAIVGDDIDMARALIEAGASVDFKTGVQPLNELISAGNNEFTTLLLEAGVDPNAADAKGMVPIMVAVGTGNIEIVDRLLADGADPARKADNGADALQIADAGGDVDVASRLLGAMKDKIAEAAARGDGNAVVQQLARGADPNAVAAMGWSPLMLAAGGGYNDVVEVLLAAKADVNHGAEDGTTALMVAALKGHGDIVRRLLAAGANPSMKTDDGVTALSIARHNGDERVVSLLSPPKPEPDAKVEEVQRLLAEIGYDPGPADGLAGPRTRRAVVKFQSDYGLDQGGGISGPLLERLRNIASARPDPSASIESQAPSPTQSEPAPKVYEDELPVLSWGAVAHYKKWLGGNRFFYSWGHTTAGSALLKVLAECGKDDCKHDTTFFNCFAISFSSGGGWSWATRDGIQAARVSAQNECTKSNRSCHTSFSVCADGSGYFKQ